jgi:hypothetical protein
MKHHVLDMMAMLAEVQQHAVALLLLVYDCMDAVQHLHCCLVQSAVGPGGTEQAALVVSTVLQHLQQACVWQRQQKNWCCGWLRLTAWPPCGAAEEARSIITITGTARKSPA